MGGKRHAPAPLPKDKPVPIVQEAGWAPRPVFGRVWKISLPPGFDSRTVQPVATTLPRSTFHSFFYLKKADWTANKETYCMKEFLKVFEIKLEPMIFMIFIIQEEFLIFSLFYLLLIFKIYR